MRYRRRAAAVAADAGRALALACSASAQPGAPGLRPEPATAGERSRCCCRTFASTSSSTRSCRSTSSFTDEDGRQVALGDYFGKRPVDAGARLLRVPDALHAGAERPVERRCSVLDQTVGKEFDVVAVSFDPRETPDWRRRRRQPTSSSYKRRGAEQGWHFLTGDEASIGALTRRGRLPLRVGRADAAVRPRQRRDRGRRRRAALAVSLRRSSTPPRDLRLALIEASAGKIGIARRSAAALLLSLRPDDGQYGLIGDERPCARRRRARVAALLGFIGDDRSRRDHARRSRALTVSTCSASHFSRSRRRRSPTDVDALYFFLVAVTGVLRVVLVSRPGRLFAIKYRRRHADEIGARIDGLAAARAALDGHPAPDLDGHVLLGRAGLLRDARGRRPTPWRSTSSASSGCGRSSTSTGQREINELHVPSASRSSVIVDLRGRDPQLLHPGVPHQDRRRARPLHAAVVRGDEAGPIPPLLRRVLRHEALGDDRQRRRDGAGAVPGMADAAAAPKAAARRARRAKLFQDLACITCHRRQRAGPRPVAAGICRQAGAAGRRQHGRRRRGLPPRVDPEPDRPRSSQGFQPLMPTFQGLVSEEQPRCS